MFNLIDHLHNVVRIYIVYRRLIGMKRTRPIPIEKNSVCSFFQNSQSKCPYCDNNFNRSLFTDHVESCFQTLQKIHLRRNLQPARLRGVKSPALKSFDESPSATILPNAFEKLMAGGSDHPAMFRLDYVDGKISPSIHFKKDLMDSSQVFFTTWSSQTNVRKLKFGYDSKQRVIRPEATGILLLTNILPFSDDNRLSKHTQSNMHPSLVKSMLQKGVRRRMSTSVAHLAIECAVVNLSDFLRRLPIICIEDGALHPGIPVIVWLMMAQSKGFTPPPSLVEYCAAVITEIAESRHRDIAPSAAIAYLERLAICSHAQ